MLFTNYITSAWRNILRHKLFSIINIMGLAIGLAAVMLITLYVKYEMSYDSFWKNADNIYRLNTTVTVPGREITHYGEVAGPIAEKLKQDFEQIVHISRFIPYERNNLTVNDEIFEETIIFTDQEITNVFSFPLIAGNLENALDDPTNMILTKSSAKKFFNDENPIGKTITLENDQFSKEYTVVALVDDRRNNTHVPYGIMVKFVEEDFKDKDDYFTGWGAITTLTFFTLADGVSIDLLNEQLPDFINRHFPSFSIDGPDIKPTEYYKLFALNINELHLKSLSKNGFLPYGDQDAVYILISVACFIIVIASINFMNLSSVRATHRSKEVVIRKVLGAKKMNLIRQFIGEAVLFSLISFLIALALMEIALPFYNEFLNIDATFEYYSEEAILFLCLTIALGFTSGVYPAFVLSSFNPAKILGSNKSAEDKFSRKFRTTLVIIQFVASISMLVTTGIVYSQLNLINNKDIGYQTEKLLTLRIGDDQSVLFNEINSIPQVTSVSWADFYPTSNQSAITQFRNENDPNSLSIITNFRIIGFDFFETLKTEMLIGREFDQLRNDIGPTFNEAMDGNTGMEAIILNEAAVKHFGYAMPNNALGETIFRPITIQDKLVTLPYKIIGVVPNIHFYDLKKEIRPEVYFIEQSSDYLFIRYIGSNESMRENISAIWNKLYPEKQLAITFIEIAVSDQYRSEKKQMILFASFSSLAIFIASMGLFGLASLTTARRTKEIGIRKVFGAKVFQIIKLLVWQFSKPVLIANIFAWPIAYLTMSRWLESFVYRIDDIVIIALCLIAGLTALLIAWATVAGNSFAVARKNPIKALRYE